MLQDHCVLCWRKKKGGFDLIQYVSNFINLRELFGWCLSILEFILEFVLQSVLKYVMLEKK